MQRTNDDVSKIQIISSQYTSTFETPFCYKEAICQSKNILCDFGTWQFNRSSVIFQQQISAMCLLVLVKIGHQKTYLSTRNQMLSLTAQIPGKIYFKNLYSWDLPVCNSSSLPSFIKQCTSTKHWTGKDFPDQIKFLFHSMQSFL